MSQVNEGLRQKIERQIKQALDATRTADGAPRFDDAAELCLSRLDAESREVLLTEKLMSLSKMIDELDKSCKQALTASLDVSSRYEYDDVVEYDIERLDADCMEFLAKEEFARVLGSDSIK